MRTRIIALYVLNYIDGLLTLAGLKNGYIYEQNPIIREIYELSTNSYIIAKVIIPMTILIAMYKYMKIETRIIKILINIVIVTYITIFILHIEIIVQAYH